MLPSFQLCVQRLFQRADVPIVYAVKVKVKYRVAFPRVRVMLFQLFDGKAGEEFFLSFPVGLYGGEKKALSKSPGPAQKIRFSLVRQAVDVCGLIHIGISVISQTFKALYADRQLSSHSRGPLSERIWISELNKKYIIIYGKREEADDVVFRMCRSSVPARSEDALVRCFTAGSRILRPDRTQTDPFPRPSGGSTNRRCAQKSCRPLHNFLRFRSGCRCHRR